MDITQMLYSICVLAPIIFMLLAALIALTNPLSTTKIWQIFQAISCSSLFFIGTSIFLQDIGALWPGTVTTTSLGLILAFLVQFLGTVIGSFSSRYLQGEARQHHYLAALACVLASVHLLLIADHWLILIGAWTLIGFALQYLLCFYQDRPFALLAAHKKRLADYVANVLLLVASALAWIEVGNGSLSNLWQYIALHGMSIYLQTSAVLLVLAVMLRTALLPVHGWLTQVMEAPTPVSALLHAGVVNLGGFVLIRFIPMLEQASTARILLVVLGLVTAILAGMVMLTRISIKVRLAWSTIAQMGFMLLECGLGFYKLAAVHLIGHSLYKAYAFLTASDIVRQTRLQSLHMVSLPSYLSLMMAPILSITAISSVVLFFTTLTGHPSWPWWWSLVLGVSWGPLLWLPATHNDLPIRVMQTMNGLLIIAGLTGATIFLHTLPMGVQDMPDQRIGLIVLVGMVFLYFFQALLQRQPQRMSRWRRWSYAGFYLDEAYTRIALHIWPTCWTPVASQHITSKEATAILTDIPR